jgi:hypothetical protein
MEDAGIIGYSDIIDFYKASKEEYEYSDSDIEWLDGLSRHGY